MYNVQFLLIYYFRDAKVLIFLDKRTKETKKICSYVLMSKKICNFAREKESRRKK